MFKKIAKEKMEHAIKKEELRKKHDEELAELIANKVVEKIGRVPTALSTNAVDDDCIG